MKLTGKCKEKFIFWMCQNHEYVRWHEYETMPQCAINALIIEFFDSVGIYIEVAEDNGWDAYVNKEWVKTSCTTRNIATEQGILVANEIFNLNNK